MAADGYFLTEADKAFLSRLREIVERNGEDAVLSVIRNQPPAELASTTECYVARTPQGGIPALTPGTAPELRVRARDGVSSFFNSDDQPGRALCDIWRVVQVEDPPRRELRPVPLLAQWVYNPSLTPIPENAWVPVIRDKFGGWWPAAAGGEQGTRPVQVIDGPYDGYYVGIIDTRDEYAPSIPERWVTTWAYVLVVGYNDEAMEIGKRYKASKVSDHPSWGLPVYAVQPVGGGGGGTNFLGVRTRSQSHTISPGFGERVFFTGGVEYDTGNYLTTDPDQFAISGAGHYHWGALVTVDALATPFKLQATLNDIPPSFRDLGNQAVLVRDPRPQPYTIPFGGGPVQLAGGNRVELFLSHDAASARTVFVTFWLYRYA